MLKTLIISSLVIFGLSGCFHQDPELKKMQTKKEKPMKVHHKVKPKLSHSFYY